MGKCAALQGPALQGVMHAGGVLADNLVPKQSLQSLRTVFAPKVTPSLQNLASL